jgi:hypothetical protein
MHSLVKCCWVGAALGCAAVLANGCGKTDVSCEDLAACPEGTGGSIDGGAPDASAAMDAHDGAGGSDGAAGRDASTSMDAAPDVSPDVSRDAAIDAGADAHLAEGAAGDASLGDASLGDAPVDALPDLGPQCEAGSDPAIEPCVVNDAYGVFVSPLGNDRADGTKAAPFRTITHALGVALAHGGRVYACGSQGVYAESLAIGAPLNGVSLYGGFDCTTWVHSSALRAVVRPTATGAALAVTGVTSLLVQEVEFDALDAVAAGDSSVAVFVASSSGVTFNRVRAVAGSGVNGVPGSAGGAGAMSGLAGGQANAACSPLSVVAPRVMSCGNEQSTGGTGGFGAGISGATGSPGGMGASTPAVAPLRGNGGIGDGQQDGVAWDCSSVDTGLGQPGGAGVDGAPGAGATIGIALSSTGWTGTSATGGLSGHIGQGGGGGGGAMAPALCPATDAAPGTTGASGGSGGSGGCGGVGGGGGTSGGWSIAVLAYSSQVSLLSSELVIGTGGRGGNGGGGQQGGVGGTGGPGATGVSGSVPSCAGGNGGRGGSGGPGGGGAGGSAVGILSTATGSTIVTTGTSFQPGVAGAAGLDGNGVAATPGAGAAGVSTNQLSL